MSVARNHDLAGGLAGIVGEQNVLTDDYSVSLYAQDVYTKDLPAMAVVQPDNTEELASALADALAHPGPALVEIMTDDRAISENECKSNPMFYNSLRSERTQLLK